MNTAKWPKILAPLTAEQKSRHDEFMQLWHEHLPVRYGRIEALHNFPVSMRNARFGRLLRSVRV